MGAERPGKDPESRSLRHFLYSPVTGLVKGADTHHLWAIEFRPDDLASPHAMRRTDDFLSQISITMNRLRDCAAHSNTYERNVS